MNGVNQCSVLFPDLTSLDFLNDGYFQIKTFLLPDCLQATQTLGSGLDRFGLTLSIVKPLGRFGIAGKGTRTFFTVSTPFLGGGGEILSLFLFRAACLVFGGEILETKYPPRF